MRIFRKCWVPVGPEWKTGDTFRIREILKDEGIPFRMPFSDVFFTSIFHMPAEDRKWSILVREKDRAKVMDLLAREGLVRGELARTADTSESPAEQNSQGSLFFLPALSGTGLPCYDRNSELHP